MDKLNFIQNNDIATFIINNIEPKYISYIYNIPLDTDDKDKLINLVNKIVKSKNENQNIYNNIDIDFFYDLITNDKYKNTITVLLNIPNKYNSIYKFITYIKYFTMFISICLIIMYLLLFYGYINKLDDVDEKIYTIISILSYILIFNTLLIYNNIIYSIAKFILLNLQYVPWSVYYFIISLIIGRLFVHYHNKIDKYIYNYKRYRVIVLLSLVIITQITSVSLSQNNTQNQYIAFTETIFYLINKLFGDYYNLGHIFPNLPKTKLNMVLPKTNLNIK